jgi:hypothetical protein
VFGYECIKGGTHNGGGGGGIGITNGLDYFRVIAANGNAKIHHVGGVPFITGALLGRGNGHIKTLPFVTE